MCYRDGGADFVGMQLVDGKLDGHRGSFVLSATGAYEGTTSKMQLEIVAGSGTGELAGISGSGEFMAGPGTAGPLHPRVPARADATGRAAPDQPERARGGSRIP